MSPLSFFFSFFPLFFLLLFFIYKLDLKSSKVHATNPHQPNPYTTKISSKPLKNLTIIKGIKSDNEIIIKGNEKNKRKLCNAH
jgi:hypothetical protein